MYLAHGMSAGEGILIFIIFLLIPLSLIRLPFIFIFWLALINHSKIKEYFKQEVGFFKAYFISLPFSVFFSTSAVLFLLDKNQNPYLAILILLPIEFISVFTILKK